MCGRVLYAAPVKATFTLKYAFHKFSCLHHMVILRTRNKITDFFMILAWASPFKCLFPITVL